MTEKTLQTVAVDTDVLYHLAEMKDCMQLDLTGRFFQELEYSPIMNERLCEHELENAPETVTEFFKSDIVQKSKFIDKLKPSERRYYERVVKDIYKRLKGTDYPHESVFKGWTKGKSFGEVHSIAMCLLFQICIFLSDDSDSKKIERFVNSSMGVGNKIIVLTRKDAAANLPKSAFNRKERQKLTYKPK